MAAILGWLVVEDVSARFQQMYGERPVGVWAAPGRVNLIGEHTDYNDGYVLPFALPHRTLVAAAPGPKWTIWSAQTGETVTWREPLTPGSVEGWAAYVAGVVWALRQRGCDVPPARLAIDSDVPLGAGLSSSAALECAVLTALVELAGLDLPVADRPALAQRAENEFVGVPCGIMDQSAAILCRAGHALFLDCRTGATEHVPFDATVLVIDTRAPHRLVSGEYAARRAACEQAARTLGLPALRDATLADLDRLTDPLIRRRARHVITENQRVLDAIALLRAGEVAALGPLLSASHASLRDDYQVTVPELDVAAEAAESAGAYGARMTGGGFGGCVIALVGDGSVDSVAAAVTDAFAAHGFRAPATFVAQPSPGAERIG
ncbi:MAG TPA: galactokinase [Natronosporangium sp.]